MLAHHVKTEKVRGRLCAVVTIESRQPEAPEMWQESLWIDPESMITLRLHFVPPGERQPDEALFDPTRAARRRP